MNNSGSTSPYHYLYFENVADNSQHYYSALFRVNDQGNANSSTAAATVIVTKAITLSPTAAATTSTNSADSSGSTGLSRSAKIGIGVGVPLGILFFIGLAFLAVWSSWRHSRAAKRDATLPGISNLDNDGYAIDNVPVVGGAGYGLAPGYSQQGASLAKPHGYVAVQQYPLMSELSAVNQPIP